MGEGRKGEERRGKARKGEERRANGTLEPRAPGPIARQPRVRATVPGCTRTHRGHGVPTGHATRAAPADVGAGGLSCTVRTGSSADGSGDGGGRRKATCREV
jgi:hypothetical protein